MAEHSVEALKSEISDLRAELGKPDDEEIYIGTYLLKRLEQLGVTHMFGVPGDFNLGFLDLVEDFEPIEWVGNCNELNSSHAADGYARVKEGLGVLLTTFGVGELSAFNGHAGAYSEHVPMLHIVGVPNTNQLKNKPLLHHTLGDGRFNAYAQAASNFSVAEAELMNKDTAAAEIDRVITAALIHARPSYLTIPTDIIWEKIKSSRLRKPLRHIPYSNEPETEKFVISEIVRMMREAEGDVVILVDACTIRHYVRDEVEELIKKTKFPVYSTPMGKTAINEENERYGGVYIGSISHPDVKEKVESAKLILSIGGLKSDFNTGNFTYKIPAFRTIELHSDHTKVQYANYAGIGMKRMFPQLIAALEPFHDGAKLLDVPLYKAIIPKEDTQDITHDFFWPRVSQFFRANDVVVSETGTSNFGLLDVPFPKGSLFLSQILWGSIGWSVGAALGAAIGARDRGLGRTLLFIGDGSIQLTAQELTPMLRLKLNPIIFLLNNRGYTIERFLHGKYRKYNDVVNWKYTQLFSTFGGEEGVTCQNYMVNTKDELEALLNDENFARADKAQLVEIKMDPFDAPRALQAQTELSGQTNKYALD